MSRVDGSWHGHGAYAEVAYLTWDTKIAGQQMSLALGHGSADASDRWAVRIGVELD